MKFDEKGLFQFDFDYDRVTWKSKARGVNLSGTSDTKPATALVLMNS